jgi:hypothetical protein
MVAPKDWVVANHPPELTAEELRKLVPVLEEKFDSKSFHLQSARAENA